MNIVVLGSGVVGVTTAYYLAKAGHAVTVVDRQPGPAMETSFANAGEISPGYASPWAGPGVPMKAIKWLVMKHGPLVIRPKADVAMWIWLLKMLRNCTHQRYAVNKSRMVELAEYSRDTLRDLRRDIGISYDDRALGTLQLFRTQKQLDGAATDIDVLRDYGVPFELLDADGCVEAEPGLADARDKIAGGLRLPGDETGDCEMFTRALVTHAAALGVTFRYGVRVLSLKMANDRISSIATDQGDIAADAFVVALGSYSPLLLKQIGLSIPVFPVKGYSITVPITQPENAPISTIMDETYKVAITRLGDRIRVGGTAEISGYDLSLDPARRATLDLSVSELFGKAGDLSRASFWAGLRPMTPDGPPIIGAARYNNLLLNTGHGTLGWTMACGSARVLSDLMSGVKPSIDISQLSMNRYANSISSAAA